MKVRSNTVAQITISKSHRLGKCSLYYLLDSLFIIASNIRQKQIHSSFEIQILPPTVCISAPDILLYIQSFCDKTLDFKSLDFNRVYEIYLYFMLVINTPKIKTCQVNQ
jgi:hypothetical protein